MPTKKTEEEKVEKSPKKSTKKTTSSKKSTTKKTTEKKVAKKPAAKKVAVKKTTKKTAEDKVTEKKTLKKELVEEITNESPKSTPKKSKKTDDFDWNEFEEGIQTIDAKQIEEFDKLIDDNFVDTYNDNVIVGEVVNITEREAIIDINAKSEGVISLNEFRYNPDLKIGDKVEVIVDIQEDKTGQLVLSHRKARTIKAWERVIDAHQKETVVTGFVKCRTKGGMIVDVFGLEAFLPGSQIDVKPIRDYDQFVNKNMEFRIVKINHEFKNVVVSHKALIEADIEEQKKEIISQLEKGQVLEGIVKNI
jgi:small subunit ribosomal protein S1